MPLKSTMLVLDGSLCPITITLFLAIDVRRSVIQYPIDGSFLSQNIRPTIYIPSGIIVLDVSFPPMTRTTFSSIDVQQSVIQYPIDGSFLSRRIGPNIYIPSDILIQSHQAFLVVPIIFTTCY